MHYPFLVADPRSGLHYRLSDTALAELSLAPVAQVWSPGRAIAEAPDPVWADSFANAPAETITAVTQALEDLVLATPDLQMPVVDHLPDSRAKRHLSALIGLWQSLGEALPEGLAPLRHVLALPHGRFLDPVPVVEGSLDPLAPVAMQALYARLQAEFGSVPAAPRHHPAARAGSRLAALQHGIAAPQIEPGPGDDSLCFYGLRDPAAAADFAASRARALIDAGIPARAIAVLAADDPRQIARAFAAQGVPLSNLPADLPSRDLIGETALHLALAKRPPTPAMVLAGLALSPLMPWPAETGRDLAEDLMGGDFRGAVLGENPRHKALWDDIRASASSLAQLRLLLDRICAQLAEGGQVRARLPIPPGDGTPDWEAILRSIQITPPICAEPDRNLEGVSLWSAYESPWRPCQHLIVADFTDGFYPLRPRANPLFLDSEIAAIRAATGLALRGRAEGLTQGLALFDQQLQAAGESVTFLVPWRDLAGARLQPAAGLSLASRAIAGVDESNLITDLSRLAPLDWPVAFHRLPPLDVPPALPEALDFAGRDLLALRLREDGTAKPQSPSRLETLLVSPLAWLLDEIGATDLSWAADTLDVLTKGNIAHDVFEHVFVKDQPIPEDEALLAAVSEAYERALSRHAGYLRSPSWEMERAGLRREIEAAAKRWSAHLQALGATIIGNEIWLAGDAHGINLHGKADAILELPDGTLLIVDHKKSGTNGRKKRMEAGWDLQAGLYRDMIARPHRHEDDGMDPLIGRTAAVAYHLMNDGGLLTSGLSVTAGSPASDMGDAVNAGALEKLASRLAELGAGRVVLNTSEDADFFEKEARFTPYALTEGSALVTGFIREIGEE